MSENFNDKGKNEFTEDENVTLENEVSAEEIDAFDESEIADNLDETEDAETQSEEFDVTDDEFEDQDDALDDEIMDEEDESDEDEETLDNKILNKVNKKVSDFNKKNSGKKAKIISIAMVVIILAVLVFTDIIPILPNAYNRFYVGNTYEIGETQGSVFDKFGKNVLYAGNGVIMSFGPDMSCDFKIDTPTGSPKLETSGNNAVVYYANSTQAIAVIDKDNVKDIATSDIITGATVNNNGYYGFVTKEAGYKSYIEIYSSNGTVIYKYHTNNPIIDIAVSDNGKSLVASSYEISDGEISGKLIFIDMTSDKTGKEVIVKSNLLSEVKFVNKDTAVAFGDLFTVAYSAGGVEKWRIKYDKGTVKSYDISSNGDIAYIFDRYNSELSESTVAVYGSGGNLKGIYESKNNIKYISANNDYFLLSLDKQTVLLDDEADVVKKKNTTKDFRKAVLYSNYNFAFSITDGVSEIMSVKH